MGIIHKARRILKRLNPIVSRKEVDALYALLYRLVNDLDNAADLSAIQTKEAFSSQWTDLKDGQYLLTDPWFKENVDRIIACEEIQIKPEWFRGKEILDAGCGNGRWTYGFAKLGANVTCVDINQSAIDETAAALSEFNDVKKTFVVSPLEEISSKLEGKMFDLVFSWGVLHHCRSFNRSLGEIIKLVDQKGVLYLYIYGRESLSLEDDLEFFKDKIIYNTMSSDEEKYRFLLKKAKGDKNLIHNLHDIYAPLVNRRLEYNYVFSFLEKYGFKDIVRTIDHTELFIRAFREGSENYYKEWVLPGKKAPYWFQHHADSPVG